MRSPSPAFSFYPKDWLSDATVMAMSLEEQGAYVRLLAIYWLEDGLPSDLGKLSRLVGVPRRRFEKLWPAIAPCFSTADGRLFQKRIEEEKAKQLAFREKQSEKGKLGGKPSHINKDVNPQVNRGLPGQKPGDTPSSPSPSPSPAPPPTETKAASQPAREAPPLWAPSAPARQTLAEAIERSKSDAPGVEVLIPAEEPVARPPARHRGGPRAGTVVDLDAQGRQILERDEHGAVVVAKPRDESAEELRAAIGTLLAHIVASDPAGQDGQQWLAYASRARGSGRPMGDYRACTSIAWLRVTRERLETVLLDMQTEAAGGLVLPQPERARATPPGKKTVAVAESSRMFLKSVEGAKVE